MVTRIALQNMKYHKSKNILIGIAIILTTLLLFLIPSIALGVVYGQCAVINDRYPNWHGMFSSINEETVNKLSVYHEFSSVGIDCRVGAVVSQEAPIHMMYVDEGDARLLRLQLSKGKLPERENEVVVSKYMLEQLGIAAAVGDTISLPYQVYDGEGLSLAKEKEFVITGLLQEENHKEEEQEQLEGKQEQENQDPQAENSYVTLVSKSFMEHEIESNNRRYDFAFQLYLMDNAFYTQIEAVVNDIAEQFHIGTNQVRLNEEYLHANYVDPEWVPIIAGIVIVIIIAGIITIYSIFYVGMSDRIREFGKLKAVGTTKHQLKQIVLREGLGVAGIAIPIGLIIGTIVNKIVFTILFHLGGGDNIMFDLERLCKEGKFSIYNPYVYLATIVIALATVYLSLMKPMRIASKVSELDAMRYQAEDKQGRKKEKRKSYREISLLKLSKIYLFGNKKNSCITISAMAMTGIFVVVVASILSCMNPKESADDAMIGQYSIVLNPEFGNKEHPEYEWSEIIKNNPLNSRLREQILDIPGITKVVSFQELDISSDEVSDNIRALRGVPQEYQNELIDGITKGSVTYEELKSGDKVIVDTNMRFKFPDINVGSKLHLHILDGSNSVKEVTVAAIGDYPDGFTGANYILMASEGVEKLGTGNLNYTYYMFSDEQYNKNIETSLEQLVKENKVLHYSSWQLFYNQMKATRQMYTWTCFAFLFILGAICIMNMINTMIHSVHLRKKQFGMMQAIGMTDYQLRVMLSMEGLFYTLGTLVVSIGGGSLLGYRAFLWAKEEQLFDIQKYHYPLTAVIILVVILLLIQMLLSLKLGKSVKKESLIERIRYSE